jgi:hypothetical protein
MISHLVTFGYNDFRNNENSPKKSRFGILNGSIHIVLDIFTSPFGLIWTRRFKRES